MDTLLVRLTPVHPHLPPDTPITDRVSITQAYLAPLDLFHPLMVSPFLAPSNAWHMMHVKAEAMGITQQMIPFMQWLRATTVAPQQVIDAITTVYLVDAILEQRQDIWSIPAPALHPSPPSQALLQHNRPFKIPAAQALPLTPTKKPVMPANRWGRTSRASSDCEMST